MPQIEVLQTALTATPGWAYVLDTGHDPSKSAINPTGSRKGRAQRTTTQHVTDAPELTRREQVAILKRLADLDREGGKEIEIPAKYKGAVGTWKSGGTGGKLTTNVRRILLSEKTFAHHLNDEEARLGQKGAQGQGAVVSTPAPVVAGRSRAAGLAQKRGSMGPPAVPSPTTATPAVGEDMVMTDASSISPLPLQPKTTNTNDADANEPLLQIKVPSLPTTEELEALVSAPPLSYNAARASPPPPFAPPQRKFCEMCGYWGRVKCLKCGNRVCGLECKEAHDLDCRRKFA
jgi:zinc finger HIT domain-containing protein 1